jgi:hypothetical protein
MSNEISLPILEKWKKECKEFVYNENVNKIELKDVDKIVRELEKEKCKLLNELKEGNYLTPNEDYKRAVEKDKGWFSGRLVDVGDNLYVFFGSYYNREGFINPIISGLTLPHNYVFYECRRNSNQKCYKGILKGFGKEEEIGKKDIIVIDPSLIEKPEGSLDLSIIWSHEREGHLYLDRKINFPWYTWIRYIIERLWGKSLENQSDSIDKIRRVDIYETELSASEELYSYLTELVYLFYSLYDSALTKREVLNYLERYAPIMKFYKNYYYALEYLQNSEVGKYLHRFAKNPNKFVKDDIEKIIKVIMSKRNKLEECLKHYIDKEIHPKLTEIEKELY